METGHINSPAGQTQIEMMPFSKLHRGFMPAFVETKYDGEFNELISDGWDVFLINKYGKTRWDCPITEPFAKYGKPLRILGELYWGDGKNGSLYDFLSNKDSHSLSFAMFDLLSHNNNDYRSLPLWERRKRLIELGIKDGQTIHIVETHWADTLDDVNDLVACNRLDGYEGVVVKGANAAFTGSNWVKIKHTATMDLEVAYIDPALERIEVFTDLQMHRCGVKVMNKEKVKLKVGDIVEIKHFGRLSGHGLRHPSYLRKRDDKNKPSYV